MTKIESELIETKSTINWGAEDLILKNIVKIFKDNKGEIKRAVDDISIKITKGMFVTLLGKSGCGKTTTLRIVAGFESPTSGEVILGKKNINSIPAYERNMPMVFQSYALFPHLTVFENIAYGLRIRKIPPKKIKNDVDMALQLVDLVGVENRYPGEISGGQQQRIALARVLVLKPKIILFDEPLSNLDAKLRIQTRMEIKRLQKLLGITTLYVTHDQAEALSMSDMIVLMKEGKIEQMGSPDEIYNRPDSRFVADFIGNANFIDAVIEEVKEKYLIIKFQGKMLKIEKVNSSGQFERNEDVIMAIKPEAITISREKSDFKGKICNKFFVGSNMEYQIEFAGNMITSIQPNNDEYAMSIPVGKEVPLIFNPNYFQIFKKGIMMQS